MDYLQFHFSLSLRSGEEKSWCIVDLTYKPFDEIGMDRWCSEHLVTSPAEWPPFNWELDEISNTLELSGGEPYEYEGAVHFLRRFIHDMRPREGLGLEAAFGEEFGGCAAWITADAVEEFSTALWLDAKKLEHVKKTLSFSWSENIETKCAAELRAAADYAYSLYQKYGTKVIESLINSFQVLEGLAKQGRVHLNVEPFTRWISFDDRRFPVDFVWSVVDRTGASVYSGGLNFYAPNESGIAGFRPVNIDPTDHPEWRINS